MKKVTLLLLTLTLMASSCVRPLNRAYSQHERPRQSRRMPPPDRPGPDQRPNQY